MSRLNRLFVMAAMCFVLATSAFAGDIGFPKNNPTPGDIGFPKNDPTPGDIGFPKNDPTPGDIGFPKNDPTPGDIGFPKSGPSALMPIVLALLQGLGMRG